eukprot:GCRY01005974.1.p1 GENE.GCRY01005974.1~~GCRY01005974.1.p1  ORF type:complete len:293 (-),score=39.22 GCRY01005974.1:6-884(-)
MYLVKPVEEKGLGAVASRDLAAGELLLEEDPYLLQPMDIFRSIPDLTAEPTPDIMKINKDLSTLFPRTLEEISLERQKQVTTPMHPILLRLYFVFLYNQFENGIFIQKSVFNHSCKPNAATTGSKLQVVSPIKKGEEITINYDSSPSGFSALLRNERARSFQDSFGFVCDCEYCRTPKHSCENSLCAGCEGRHVRWKNDDPDARRELVQLLRALALKTGEDTDDEAKVRSISTMLKDTAMSLMQRFAALSLAVFNEPLAFPSSSTPTPKTESVFVFVRGRVVFPSQSSFYTL